MRSSRDHLARGLDMSRLYVAASDIPPSATLAR